MQRIRAWLHKQHPQFGIAFEQASNEELVAAPHLVPPFERANNEIAYGIIHPHAPAWEV